MRPSPSSTVKSLACPPGNSTPSIVPVKSTTTRSPFCAGRPASCHVARCLRSTSSVRSTSAGSTADVRALDGKPRHVGRADLRVDLEDRGELDRVGRRRVARARLDAGIARDAQLLRAHGLVEALAHGVRDHVRAHLRPVLLRDHLHGHVAGPEAGKLHRLREPPEPLLHFAFDVGERNGDVESPGELPEILESRLHAFGILANVVARRGIATRTKPEPRTRRGSIDAGWCERGDSNPHGGHPPEPKSGASTNSATFASRGKRRSIAFGDQESGSRDQRATLREPATST